MPLCRVLVVDDDKLIGWALTRELSARDAAVHVVVTAEDGLQELRRPPGVDFLFLDVNLPDANGLDLLDEIRAVAPMTKIVVMSADGGETVRQRAMDGGALQFLEKPFDLVEVHRIIRSALCAPTPQRKQPRYICRVPLRISVVQPARDEAHLDLENLPGLMADVGAGGLRLRTEYPLKVGQRIRPKPAENSECFGRFVPPDVRAEVVWVMAAGDEFVAGLRFIR